MEHKTPTQTAIPKIRTFADDRRRASPTEQPPGADELVSHTKTETPKAKGATPIPNAASTPTPRVSPPAIPKKPATPPAFHTLQKKATGKNSLVAIPKKNTTETIKITGSNEDYANTTIIRDTVHRKTNIFSAIGVSIMNLKRDIKRFWKKANQPIYVIPDTERRKGVIQQATSQTGKSFTSDYERLKERLRQRAEQSVDTPEQDISWSPLTEPGFQLLPGSSTSEVINVQVEPKRLHSTQIAVPEKPSTEVTKPVPVPNPAPRIPPPIVIEPKSPIVPAVPTPPPPTPEPTPEKPDPTPIVRSVESVTAPTTPPNTQALESITTPGNIPAVPTPPPPTPRSDEAPAQEVIAPAKPTTKPTRKSISAHNDVVRSFNQIRTNTLTIGIAGFLITSAVLLIIGSRVIDVVWPTQTAESPVVAIPTAITNYSVVPVHYTITSADSLLTTILTHITTQNLTAVELQVVHANGVPWTTDQLLRAQNLTVNPSFAASVQEVRWVVTTGGQLAIVFTYTNPTQIRGSLLAWEGAMVSEISRLLTSTNTTTGGFVDRTISDIDVRSVGGTGITYGLVTDSVGVIAPDEATFMNLATTITR